MGEKITMLHLVPGLALILPIVLFQAFLLSGWLINIRFCKGLRQFFPSYRFLETIRSRAILMEQSIANDFPELSDGTVKSDPNSQHRYWRSQVYEPNKRLKLVRAARLQQRVYRVAAFVLMLLTWVLLGAGIQRLIAVGSLSGFLLVLVCSANTAFLIYMAVKMSRNLVVISTKAEWANRYWQRKGVPKDQIHGTA